MIFALQTAVRTGSQEAWRAYDAIVNRPGRAVTLRNLLAFDVTMTYAFHWQSVTWTPPEDYNKLLARDVEDNELWWYKDRPNLIEW